VERGSCFDLSPEKIASEGVGGVKNAEKKEASLGCGLFLGSTVEMVE